MLYCNTVTGPQHDVGQGVGRAGWRAWGAQAGGRRMRVGGRARVLGARRTRGRAAGARQAEHRRAGRAAGRRWARAAWARGLALGCALGALGLFSIRFDSVLFLSQILDVVCEPGS